jgi:hypothetical protein
VTGEFFHLNVLLLVQDAVTALKKDSVNAYFY